MCLTIGTSLCLHDLHAYTPFKYQEKLNICGQFLVSYSSGVESECRVIFKRRKWRQMTLLYPSTQILFPIGGESITCDGSKLPSLGVSQLEFLTHTWPGLASCSPDKYVCQPTSRKINIYFQSSYYYWVVRYNKTLKNWPSGKPWVCSPYPPPSDSNCSPQLRQSLSANWRMRILDNECD